MNAGTAIYEGSVLLSAKSEQLKGTRLQTSGRKEVGKGSVRQVQRCTYVETVILLHRLGARVGQFQLCYHEPHKSLPAVVLPVAGHRAELGEEPSAPSAGCSQQLVTLVR